MRPIRFLPFLRTGRPRPGRPRPGRSLQGRLILGLAATWLAVVGLLLAAGWWMGRSLTAETTFTHLSYQSRLIADELGTQVETRLDALQRLGRMLDAEAHGGQALLTEELRHNQALMAWFDGLLVVDGDGRVVADWPVLVGRWGGELAPPDMLSRVHGHRRPQVSEPFVGRHTGRRQVMFAVPRWRDGEVDGLVAGIVDLEGGGLFQRLRRLRLGQGGFAAVVSASGTIVHHPDPALIGAAAPSPSMNPRLHQALDGWQGETVAPLMRGGEAYQSFHQIWPADWIVGVSLPTDQVQGPVTGLIGRLGGLGVGVALVLLPLMAWLVHRTLRPLHRLERQIDEVGEGRRERVDLATDLDEIRRLADTFNSGQVERSRALTALEDRQAFLDAVMDSSPQGLFVIDGRGRTTYVNPALSALIGRDTAGPEECDWTEHLHPEDRDSALDLWRHSLASGDDFLRQFRYYRADGRELWLEVHAGEVALDGRRLGFVGTVKDITEHQQQEALRRWEAEHDPLTGLLNRRGFHRRLEEALADWQKTGTASALLLFDLDHFKPINDDGGHALGDEMLRGIARVVEATARRSDYLARQGGDEFAVLMPSASLARAADLAEALRLAVGEVAVDHAGRRYRVTLSIGLAGFRPGDTRIEDLLERADAASYRAKAAGRDRVVVDA